MKALPSASTFLIKNETGERVATEVCPHKIRITTMHCIYYLEMNDIVRIQSVSNYSKIIFTNGQTLVVTKVLAYFEELLAGLHFSRVHRTHLVNLAYLKQYINGTEPQISMSNNDRLPVSRRRKRTFQQKMLAYTL